MKLLHCVLSAVATLAVLSLIEQTKVSRLDSCTRQNDIDQRPTERTKDDDERPLIVFPLLKELRAGWANMEIPPLVKRNAAGTGALIVDIGLDTGEEFFRSIEAGFEVVGFEANPKSMVNLITKCNTVKNCQVIDDITTAKLPLNRTRGMSYLINAGVGAKSGESLTLNMLGPSSSFVAMESTNKLQSATVPLIRLDDVIQEDVWLLKIDTQGYDAYVLQGAERLFQDHTVRQVITEVEPLTMNQLGVNFIDMVKMLQSYGMICFSDLKRTSIESGKCDYFGDSAYGFKEKFFDNVKPTRSGLYAECWEDFLCLNIEKVWKGPAVPLA